MPASFGPEYVCTLREVIAHLQSEVSRLLREDRGLYKEGSQAAIEHATYKKADSVFNAGSLAVQLIESAADHLSVFNKILVEPIESIAAWTCIRSMLECCALASWLLDPGIDAHTRVGRVFALRYEGMEQERKFGKAANRPTTELAAIGAKIDAVERDSLSLGFARLQDKKRKRIGIGEMMPSATHIITMMLDEETMYRLLSAVAHGHSWAIRQLCYTPSEGGDEQVGGTQVKSFQKAVGVVKIAVLGQCGVRAFICALWNQCRYNGWDSLRFEELFENVADRMSIANSRRFWRD